jgi:integrase
MDEDDAELLHAELTQAANDRERFDIVSGLPLSKIKEDDVTIAQWCKIFLDRDAQSYVPSTRVHLADDFVVLIARSAPPAASTLSRAQHAQLKDWLANKGELSSEVARWLARWSPRLRDLERADLVRILERVSLREDTATPLASSTKGNRTGRVRQVLNDAVARGRVTALDWPTAKRGSKKKSERRVDKRNEEAISLADMERVIACALNQDRRSKKHHLATAITGYAGLRPSEVYALEVADLRLPGSGWGSIRVDKTRVEQSVRWAMDGDQEFDEPKCANSVRTVPIPPVLVAIFARYLDERGMSEGRIFPGGVGFSHWPDSLKLASQKAEVAHLSPYSLRRAYASHLSVQGTPLSKIAQRMGHTVKTLTDHYLKAVDGSDEAINASMDDFYVAASASASATSLSSVEVSTSWPEAIAPLPDLNPRRRLLDSVNNL